jgi:hypothetical protein
MPLWESGKIPSREGIVFSEGVLKIEAFGPNEDYLAIIDVPRIFRTTTEGSPTEDNICRIAKSRDMTSLSITCIT